MGHYHQVKVQEYAFLYPTGNWHYETQFTIDLTSDKSSIQTITIPAASTPAPALTPTPSSTPTLTVTPTPSPATSASHSSPNVQGVSQTEFYTVVVVFAAVNRVIGCCCCASAQAG